MQIIQINPSLRSNQVWLKFDDQSLLPLKIDDLVVLKLKKFVDFSPEFYHQILISSAGHLLSEYALRQIAISPKVEKVLRQKLKLYSQRIIQKYNYPQSIIDDQSEVAIQKIISLGLLDESKFVEYLVRRYPKKSTAELNFKLKTLGVTRQITSDSSVEFTKIFDLIKKKYRNVDFIDYNSKNKLIAKLYRKGFALEFIKTAIDEYLKIR